MTHFLTAVFLILALCWSHLPMAFGREPYPQPPQPDLSQLDLTQLNLFVTKIGDPCAAVVPFYAFYQCKTTTRFAIDGLRLSGDAKYKYLVLKSLAVPFYTKHPDELPSLDSNVGSFVQPAQLTSSISPAIFNTVIKHRNRPIYFLLFATQMYQDLALARMSAYIEALPTKIMNDQELGSYLAKNSNDTEADGGGYDLRLSDITRFFQQAGIQNIALNPFEVLFLKQLRELKLISADGYDPVGNVAILSTSQNASLSDRNHEFNHGIYFTDSVYREAAQSLFAGLSQDRRDAATGILQKIVSYYNFKGDEDLAIREFVAWYRDPEDLIEHFVQDTGLKVLIEDLAIQVHRLDGLVPEYSER